MHPKTLIQLQQVPCKHSRGTGCKLISDRIGFPVGIGKSACERCLSGGVDTESSVALREDLINRVLSAVRDNPEVAFKVRAFDGWQKTRLSWGAAVNWVKSTASKVLGPIPLHILETRKRSCFGKTSSEACPMMRKHTDGFHYCGACGCGVREDTRLDGTPSKLEFPYLQCPLGRDGFSNEKVPDRLLRQVPGNSDPSTPGPKGADPISQPLGQAGGPHIVPPAG